MSAGTSPSPSESEARAVVYRLHCLGNFRLARLAEDTDLTPKGRKARALIAYLAFNDAPASRERLAGLLWGERGEEQARASLRNTLLELRALSADDHALLSVEREHVGLVRGRLTTELRRLEEWTAQGDFAAIDRCLSPWDGKIFADLDSIDPGFDEWLTGERVRQHEKLLGGLTRPLTAALASEHSQNARSIIAKLIQMDPANETVVQLAMRADHLAGDVSAIRRRYQRLQEHLRSEFNTQPSAETQRLHDELVSSAGVTRPAADAGTPSIGPLVSRAKAARTPTIRSSLSRSLFPLIAVTALAALAIVVLTVAAQWNEAPAPAPAEQPSVAVLPFDNLSGDPALAFFSDGISAEIQATLARYQTGMRVVGMASSSRFRAVAKDYSAIRKALGVTHVVEGSVMRGGDRARIITQLVDARNGAVVWTETFDRGLQETLEVRTEIARQTARVLRIAAPPIVTLAESISPKALDHYFRALQPIYIPLSNEPDLERRVKGFEAATREAPNFARAWAALAYVYAEVARTQDEREQTETRQKARQAAERAAALDPHWSVAHAILASHEPRWNWHAKAARFKRAFANGSDDSEALRYWSAFLGAIGRLDDRWKVNYEIITLDPLSVEAQQFYWGSLGAVGNVTLAHQALQSFVEQDPSAAWQWVDFFTTRLANHDVPGARRALIEIEKNRTLFKRDFETELQRRYSADYEGKLRHLQHRLNELEGRLAASRATNNQLMFDELQERPGQGCAIAALRYLAGETDHPRLDLAWRIAETLYVEKGYVGTRGMCPLSADYVYPMRQAPTQPLFSMQTASLRRDVRIWRIFKAVGLAQYWLDTDKWPDFCAEPDLPYDCKAEAKKAVVASN